MSDTDDTILYDTLYSLVSENDLETVLKTLSQICADTGDAHAIERKNYSNGWRQASEFLSAASDGARQLKI